MPLDIGNLNNLVVLDMRKYSIDIHFEVVMQKRLTKRFHISFQKIIIASLDPYLKVLVT